MSISFKATAENTYRCEGHEEAHKYSATYNSFRNKMELSGQPKGPSTLPPATIKKGWMGSTAGMDVLGSNPGSSTLYVA